MLETVQDEFRIFLEDMERNETFCKYLDESEYEYDYSHSDIEYMQEKFIEKATEWLRKNKPGKYMISEGWCVFVMTEEEAKKRNIHNYEHLLIS